MIPALPLLWKVWCFLRQGFSLVLGWFVGMLSLCSQGAAGAGREQRNAWEFGAPEL